MWVGLTDFCIAILISVWMFPIRWYFFIFSGNVTFLSPNKKVTKEIGTGEALNVALPRARTALSCVPLPART